MVDQDGLPALDFKRADLSLRDRVAIVTGASRGLGEAIALGYAHAGAPRGAAPTLEVPVERWDELLRANLHSVFYCCQAVGKHMVARGYGKIINMSSQMGLVGYR